MLSGKRATVLGACMQFWLLKQQPLEKFGIFQPLGTSVECSSIVLQFEGSFAKNKKSLYWCISIWYRLGMHGTCNKRKRSSIPITLQRVSITNNWRVAHHAIVLMRWRSNVNSLYVSRKNACKWLPNCLLSVSAASNELSSYVHTTTSKEQDFFFIFFRCGAVVVSKAPLHWYLEKKSLAIIFSLKKKFEMYFSCIQM